MRTKQGSVEVGARVSNRKALTTYIENGFQRNLKTGAVFLDLTAAYDTIWHTGLLVELTGSLPSWFVSAGELLLRNRCFRAHMGDKTSAWRTQKNGLPQGSVFAPTLFNLYTNDLPVTLCRRFAYAEWFSDIDRYLLHNAGRDIR